MYCYLPVFVLVLVLEFPVLTTRLTSNDEA